MIQTWLRQPEVLYIVTLLFMLQLGMLLGFLLARLLIKSIVGKITVNVMGGHESTQKEEVDLGDDPEPYAEHWNGTDEPPQTVRTL